MMIMKQEHKDRTPFQQLCAVAWAIMVIYVIVVAVFPFLAGKQLYFRDSRSNYSMMESTGGTGEITADMDGVNQVFVTNVQKLEQISLLWGTFGRENHGTIYVELYRQSDYERLAIQTLDVSEIKNGSVTVMLMDEPLEGLCGVPLVLRISSPNAVSGSSVTLMINDEESIDGGELYIDNRLTSGVLCFAVQGEDYIWTGLHYKEFAIGLGAVIATGLLLLVRRAHTGKARIVMNTIVALNKYQFLIHQLVSRDFKTKYKRSILGILWSLLNPLLMTLVQYMVFSRLFRFDIPYYPVYLLSGVILYNFFAESCGLMLSSITGNASLITKVYVPKYIYPLTRMLSSLINLLIAMIPLLIITLLSGLHVTRVFLLLPVPLICLGVFALGVGMVLASAMVFFRDTQFLWGILNMVWMYATPIFYPASILPDQYKFLTVCNPLYYFISMVRTMLINGISPEPMVYFQCMGFAVAMLAIGAFVFKKTQDKFVLHL